MLHTVLRHRDGDMRAMGPETSPFKCGPQIASCTDKACLLRARAYESRARMDNTDTRPYGIDCFAAWPSPSVAIR